MLITFQHNPAGRTTILIRRADGVVVGLPSYDREKRVPHDLAHLAAERELGLFGGLFGSIAGGGMFVGMSIVEGQPRHDAAERSRRLLNGNKLSLGGEPGPAGADEPSQPCGQRCGQSPMIGCSVLLECFANSGTEDQQLVTRGVRAQSEDRLQAADLHKRHRRRRP